MPATIYPIHPSAAEVEGLKAYPSLGRTPEPVDYAYVAIGAERIPDAIAEANGRCRIAQVISSGFGEVEEGIALEHALVEKARAAKVRVLGPNTLGTYSPRGGLTFPQNAPKAVGTVGIVAQSGGLSTDIVKRGEWRGLRFSGLVTIGNSADVGPHELVEYYLEDPQTKVIGLYLEDIKNGRAFFDLLRSPKATKPVVILKGGRSRQGRLAAASHTGALAGDERAWEALPSQLPVAMVSTVDEFLDALLALQFLTPRPSKPTNLVTLFGNGGGSSVLGKRRLRKCRPECAAVRSGDARAAGSTEAAAGHQRRQSDRYAGAHAAGEGRPYCRRNPRHRLSARQAGRCRHASEPGSLRRTWRGRPTRQSFGRDRTHAEEMARRRAFRAGAAQRRLARTRREESAFTATRLPP